MPGAISRLEGMRECREALQELSRSTQRNLGKRALKAPATVIAAAVKARAPVSSRPTDPTKGSLKASVKVAPSRAERGRPTIVVLADDVAAVPNEFGTSKMTAQPFFRPAVDTARDAAGAAMAEALKLETDAAIKRVAGKGAK
jgi:HK97 gp10 family phage protein